MYAINIHTYGATPEREPDHHVESIMETTVANGVMPEPEIKLKPIGSGSALAASHITVQKKIARRIKDEWMVCSHQEYCGESRAQPRSKFDYQRRVCKVCRLGQDLVRRRAKRERMKMIQELKPQQVKPPWETLVDKPTKQGIFEHLAPSPYDLTWLFADEPGLQQELEADAKLNYRTSAMQLAWIVKQRYTFKS